MKFKEPSSLMETIILLTLALLVFSSLAPTVIQNLASGNYSDNVLAQSIVPLVGVIFLIAIVVRVYKDSMGKKLK
jgi:hypothetical protein